MKFSVIVAGLFGSTVAIELAKAGYMVKLFDSTGELLASASGINEYRLHRGYHYPRSMPTALSSRLAEPYFSGEYGKRCWKMPTVIVLQMKEVSYLENKTLISAMRLNWTMNRWNFPELIRIRYS